jgi:hypothetical protein
LVGLSCGGLAFYALVRFKFLKYFIKDSNSNENCSVKSIKEGVEEKEESQVSHQVQALLLQTALCKENKNFDGIYKVILIRNLLIYRVDLNCMFNQEFFTT